MTPADQHGVYLTHEEYAALLAERDRLRDENEGALAIIATERAEVLKLRAERDRLREESETQMKYRAQHWFRRNLEAPEDAEIKALCDKYGYGAVMDAASRLWARTPYGSGAFYVGGCIGVWTDDEARAALKGDQT